MDQARQDESNASAAQSANTSALIGSLGNIAVGAAAGMGGRTPRVSEVNQLQEQGYTLVSDPAGNFLDNRTEPIVID